MGLLIDGKRFEFDDLLHVHSSMQLLFPDACTTSQEKWANLADVYHRREREFAAVWAKCVLAACPDQLRLLCCVFNIAHHEENRLLALYAGIKAGMFVDLIRVVSEDKGEAKRAQKLFEALYTGVTAGRKYQEQYSV